MKVEGDSHSTSSGEGSNADSGRGPSEEGENNIQGKKSIAKLFNGSITIKLVKNLVSYKNINAKTRKYLTCYTLSFVMLQ